MSYFDEWVFMLSFIWFQCGFWLHEPRLYSTLNYEDQIGWSRVVESEGNHIWIAPDLPPAHAYAMQSGGSCFELVRWGFASSRCSWTNSHSFSSMAARVYWCSLHPNLIGYQWFSAVLYLVSATLLLKVFLQTRCSDCTHYTLCSTQGQIRSLSLLFLVVAWDDHPCSSHFICTVNQIWYPDGVGVCSRIVDQARGNYCWAGMARRVINVAALTWLTPKWPLPAGSTWLGKVVFSLFKP